MNTTAAISLSASVALLAFSACSKKVEPSTARAVQPAVLAKPPPTASANVPADPAPAALPTKEGELPSHQVLYNAIQKYMKEHQGRAAKNVDELISNGYLPRLPAPPPGKKYDLDQRFVILKVVDK